MTDTEQILEDVVAHLTACMTGSGHAYAGKLPNADNVLLGDYPTPAAAKYCYTVDWGTVGDQYATAYAGQPMNATTDVLIRLYVDDIPANDDARKVARQCNSTSGGTLGLIPSLRLFRGAGYMLAPVTSRYLTPEEKPNFRFSIGLEVRCQAKQIG